MAGTRLHLVRDGQTTENYNQSPRGIGAQPVIAWGRQRSRLGGRLGPSLVGLWLFLCVPSQAQQARPPEQGLPPQGPPSYQRIVSLAPAITEILFALGVGERIVGVTRYCDHPPQVQGLPRVGGYLDPSSEAVLALRPDLVVVAPSPGNHRPVLALQGLGLEVVVVADQGLDDLRRTLDVLGEQLGCLDRARKLWAGIQGQIVRVQAMVESQEPRKVLLVYGHRPLIVAGPSSFGGELLALLGARNICEGSKAYPSFSMERVLAAGPEIILDAAMDGGSDARAFWSRWSSIPAVQQGRVVSVSSSALRAGPRIGQALEDLARAIYPEAFAAAPPGPPAQSR